MIWKEVELKILYSTSLNVELVYEINNLSLLFSGSRKIQNPRVHRFVENSTILVSHWNCGPQGWDFSVPTELQWWILFISHTCTSTWERYKTNNSTSTARWPHVDPPRHCKVKKTSACRISAYIWFSGSLFNVFSIKNDVFSGEQKRIH